MEIIRITEKCPMTAATVHRAKAKHHKRIISGRTKNAILRGISYGAFCGIFIGTLFGESHPAIMYATAAVCFGWLGLFVGVNGNRRDLFHEEN